MASPLETEGLLGRCDARGASCVRDESAPQPRSRNGSGKSTLLLRSLCRRAATIAAGRHRRPSNLGARFDPRVLTGRENVHERAGMQRREIDALSTPSPPSPTSAIYRRAEDLFSGSACVFAFSSTRSSSSSTRWRFHDARFRAKRMKASSLREASVTLEFRQPHVRPCAPLRPCGTTAGVARLGSVLTSPRTTCHLFAACRRPEASPATELHRRRRRRKSRRPGSLGINVGYWHRLDRCAGGANAGSGKRRARTMRVEVDYPGW